MTGLLPQPCLPVALHGLGTMLGEDTAHGGCVTGLPCPTPVPGCEQCACGLLWSQAGPGLCPMGAAHAVLTLQMRDTGMLLKVRSMLAFTPGGGSNTKMRPARSRFTGTWGGCARPWAVRRGQAVHPTAPYLPAVPRWPAHLGVDLHGEEEAEAGVRLQGVQLLLQLHQPAGCQVHVLQHHPPAGKGASAAHPPREPGARDLCCTPGPTCQTSQPC